jgi:two-component system chemotaxis response regulator CheY
MSAERPLILVVDDSTSMRQMLAFTLEDAGFAAETAENGAVALTRLSELADVACVLADINMPVMDGVQLIRAIRESKSHAHLPVVVVSKDDQVKSRSEAMAAGATVYLIKPFATDALIQMIKRAIA